MGWLLLLSGGWSVKVYLKRRFVEGLGEEEHSRQRGARANVSREGNV